MTTPPPRRRTRADLCPGVLRPWPADDGALVRLRVPGGRLAPATLSALADVAARYGDGRVHLTSRANLQLRGLPATDGRLDEAVVAQIAATGLLPSATHELVRNIVVSPLTGLAGGRADLRPVTDRLDAGLRADPVLAQLPGRFLFVLDDGRGDVVDRECDLGLVALDPSTAQMRVGSVWSDVAPLAAAAERLLGLARSFVDARGSGPGAPWHVRELDHDLVPAHPADPRLPSPAKPADPADSANPADSAAPGAVGGSPARVEVVAVPDGVLTPGDLARVTAPDVAELVLTPWRGVVVVRA